MKQTADNHLSDLRRLPVLLHRSREAFAAQFRPVFLQHDLTDQQWRVLQLIQNNPSLDISELVKRSYILGPSLSRILRDLAGRRLIVREADPEDARRAFHRLTPEGEKLISEVRPHFDPIYADLASRLSREEIHDLNNRLEAVLAALGREGS